MHKSEFHNAKETKEILEKGSPNAFFKVYHKKKKGPIHHPGGKAVNKLTLSQRMDRLEGSIDRLAEEMRAGFKQVNTRIDRIEVRLDHVEKRLDYNNLKDLPRNK